MAVDSSIDLELQLKKRARRRLVGAIALVLLMVIVLPMVLHDRASDQSKQEVTITIPSEVIHNNTTQKAIISPIDVMEQTLPKSTIIDNNETNPTTIVGENVKGSTAEDKLTDQKSDYNKQTDSTKTLGQSATTSNTKFYVQIGVFSDVDNVKKLQVKLADLGYKSQTEKINTDKGEKIRLRTSTFKERNEAAIALENIKSNGMAGIVVSQK